LGHIAERLLHIGGKNTATLEPLFKLIFAVCEGIPVIEPD